MLQTYEEVLEKVNAIKEHPVYKQVLKDSLGGIMYNVANYGKYDTDEVLALWDGMDQRGQDAADGIMTGAIQFMKGDDE